MGSLSSAFGRSRRAVEDKLADVTVIDLRRRVHRLEEEVQECRALNLRLAELTDLVTELLLPVAQRDEEKVTELLERYQRSL
ncbi:MAG: DUF6752 domain-containing protein [Nocardioides sp.]